MSDQNQGLVDLANDIDEALAAIDKIPCIDVAIKTLRYVSEALRAPSRTFTSEERRIIADALHRASSDTRNTRDAWSGPIPKAIGNDARAARTREALDVLAHVQDRLATEISDYRYDLNLEPKE